MGVRGKSPNAINDARAMRDPWGVAGQNHVAKGVKLDAARSGKSEQPFTEIFLPL